MRKTTSFLPVPPWIGDHFRAAQMTAMFPSASAFLQTTVIFWATFQAHFKGYDEHGIRLLAREPQQISHFWGQTPAYVQPAVLTKQSAKSCQVSEMPLEEMAVCVMMGTGGNLQAPSSLENLP